MKVNLSRPQWLLGIVLALTCGMPSISFGQADLESGQYYSAALSTNVGATSVSYFFEALSNDTLIVRAANADALYRNIVPDYSIVYVYTIPAPSVTNVIVNNTNQVNMVANSTVFTSVSSGWYRLTCSLPQALMAISNTFSYTVSFLRMPNAPLSHADTDVGEIRNGDAIEGKIDVGADLDAAMFTVSNNCMIQFRMGQIDVSLVPNIQIYDPTGALVSNAFPTEYRSEITTYLTLTGLYTVVCNDQLNGVGNYSVSMVQMPGGLPLTDTDIGHMISGETKTGEINLPGDLDIATFTAFTGDVVRLTMTKIDVAMNPVMELYNPAGTRLARATDVFHQSVVITNTTATNGTYYVICKDAEDRYEVSYSLTLELLSGPSSNSLPAVPAGVSATDGTYLDRIVVIWNQASGAVGYDLYRSYGTNLAVQIVTNLDVITYTDYNVVTGTYYYYKVKSRNSYGTSAFSDTDSGYSGTIAVSINRYAVLVGINKYDPVYGPTDLNSAINDAYGIRDTVLLSDPSNRWSSLDIQILTDNQATKSVIRAKLNSLAAKADAGDLILYTHSSHGGETVDNTFISAYDANFTDAELASDLAQFNADTKVIIIIDTCNSGGMFFRGETFEWPFADRVMGRYRQIMTDKYRKRGIQVPKALGQNIAFMTSSASNELSYEGPYYGYYSGNLIGGCSISSVDANNDGEYQFLELHDYAVSQVAPTQNPQTYNSTLLESTAARGVGTGRSISHNLGNDYDGDGTSDLALYQESTGYWYIWSLTKGLLAWDFKWGGPGYKAIRGDYDGDRICDVAVYNETASLWYIWSLQKTNFVSWATYWGGSGLTPVAGDYGGSGKFDLALYDLTEGFWYIVTMAGTPIVLGTSWTGAGFTPVSGDYDGDYISDYALYHDTEGYWYVRSVAGSSISWGMLWGGSGYTPVSGDYDADGKSDLAVYHEATGTWYVWSLATQDRVVYGTGWGGPGYIPVSGDYDGDGYTDLAVYHEPTGYWFIYTLNGNRIIAEALQFGGPGYVPVQSTW